MKILIKQARITDPSSPLNGQSADIFIENGTITSIGSSINERADQVITGNGLHASPGWVDVFANFADPGYEFKETLESGAAAAAAGGYTDVMVIPNTNPALHNKAAVEYVVQKSRLLPVTVHPIGAITKNTEGKELAEMYDMSASGALAFGDGLNCVQSAGLLVKALQYVKAFDGILIQLPDDKTINPQGLMNEGIVSTQLGLPGKPAMAEELIVARDIKLTRYAESKLHFTGVSTAKSLEYIKRGKDSGAAISCSVTPYHLFFSDEDLTTYDTNLKVNPPLRTKENRTALQDAVANGTVDCLASHHLPHEYDSKVVEFEYAKFGMTSLETAYAVLQTAISGLAVEKCVDLLAVNPRKIFGLPPANIREGNTAIITLFEPATTWTVTHEGFKSKSSNSPFIGKELTGKVKGIINGEKITLS
jgi:dihydroorotase